MVKIQNLKIDQATQDGYVLTSDANGNASWKASSGGMFSNSRTFTSNGTFPVPNNVAMVMVEVWSGGGGGGGGAGSGQQSNCGKAGDGKPGGSGKVVVYY